MGNAVDVPTAQPEHFDEIDVITRTDLMHVFDDHAGDLRRFLLSRVACEATAADLTQETFLRLTQIPNYRAIENLRAYLFRIAANLATDHLRARTRRTTSSEKEATLLDFPDSASTPEAALLAKQELIVALEALAELSPLCRQIFVLNRFEGLPHRKIADQLSICTSTVEKNIARALNHCRRRLNESAG